MLNANEYNEAVKWCDELEQLVKSSISQKGVVSSGALINSVKASVVVDSDDKLIIVYEMWDYGYYQDEGVKGANPSAMPKGGVQKAPASRFSFGSGSGKGSLFKSLDSWIVKKGIAPRGASGKFASRAGLKYVISRSIFLQGLPPRQFFQPVWKEQYKLLVPMLEKGLIKDIEFQWYERITKKHN
jgi:hypothetical protein